jgi:hypothetical protein
MFVRSRCFISFLSCFTGLAYDLKTVSQEMIRKRILRTGDGSHPLAEKLKALQSDDHSSLLNNVWGWDDRDMTEEERQCVEYSYVKKEE